MKAIVENLLSANERTNNYLREQFKEMFTRYGPATVDGDPHVHFVDFAIPPDVTAIYGAIDSCPEQARRGQYSPFRDRNAASGDGGEVNTLPPLKDIPGLYVILTDYPCGDNPCTYEVGGLQAVYRGESNKVRDRLLGHLFRKLYDQSLKKGQVPWPGFMRIGQDNGINIDQTPYVGSKWQVIVYPLPGCDSNIRRQAELAFDGLFGKPVASTN